MNITEFLDARIAEDEREAGSGWERLGETRWERDNYGRTMFTPSAVLAECAAKRAILAEHGWEYADPYESWKDEEYRTIHGDTRDQKHCTRCGGTTLLAGHGERGLKVPWPCNTVKAFLAVYKDHPDYQQEWAK